MRALRFAVSASTVSLSSLRLASLPNMSRKRPFPLEFLVHMMGAGAMSFNIGCISEALVSMGIEWIWVSVGVVVLGAVAPAELHACVSLP